MEVASSTAQRKRLPSSAHRPASVMIHSEKYLKTQWIKYSNTQWKIFKEKLKFGHILIDELRVYALSVKGYQSLNVIYNISYQG